MRRVFARLLLAFRWASYSIGATILVLWLGNVSLSLALKLRDALGSGFSPALTGQATAQQRYCRRVAALPPLRDYEWALGCAGEHAASLPAEYAPYKVWRRGPLDGQYIHVDEQGVRRTVGSPQTSDCARVFLFGGSTMWGSWVPDAQTVASLMQAQSDSHCFINYGETGYGSVQELNELLEQLARGNLPDIVLFYDGYNDSYAGVYSPGMPRSHQNLDAIRARFERVEPANPASSARAVLALFRERTAYGALMRARHDSVDGRGAEPYEKEHVQPFVAERAQAVLTMYEAAIRQVKALAREYDFDCVFVWQPNLLQGTRNMTECESELYNRESEMLREVMKVCYRVAKERLEERQSEGIFFLGNCLDSAEEPLYVDPCHLGPKGNALIAEELLRILRTRARWPVRKVSDLSLRGPSGRAH